MSLMSLLVVIVASALLCAGLIVVLRPLLVRYALARPNARSSHVSPTPQGGGVAVLAATLLVGGPAVFIRGDLDPAGAREILCVAAAASSLALVGAWDDIRPLPALLRLIAQGGAVGLVVLNAELGTGRLAPEAVPLWLERGVLVVAGVWFVNLVNFMDGLDWMTVAETVPVLAAIVLLTAFGAGTPASLLLAAALLGAVLGFAPFNRPVATLFLGDVGSLPVGLLLGWLLLKLAGAGGLAAALLLPLYYLADATLTLLRRLARGERVWEAHRSHYYQQATANGFAVPAVVGHVFALNLALAALALVAWVLAEPPIQALAFAAGAGLVALVLRRFSRPRKGTA